jgi:peptide/nickel transport system substrate-binding protein
VRGVLAAALLAAILPAGCGGSGATRFSGNEPRAAGGGGTLSFAIPNPAGLDPLRAATTSDRYVDRQIYEPLVASLDGPYRSVRDRRGLAVGWSHSADFRIWSFQLRHRVRFQDGTPFNAAAVLANSRRWQSDRRGRALLPHLFAVDAPRPDEVRFLLDKPVRDLPGRLADPRLGIVSPHALEPQSGQGARFLKNARGSGTGAFQPGAEGPARLELSRFAGWGGSPLSLGPALDGVAFVAAPLPDQRFRLLAEGAVQVADPLDAAGLRAADADPLLATVGGPERGIGMEGSVRGIPSAGPVPALSGVWLTRLTG